MAAEHNIDLIVAEKFFSKLTGPGVAVEVGAADPKYLSIGAHFRKLGWTVLSIEPNPKFCDLHRELGNDVFQYACSNRNEDDVDFYVVDSFGREYMGGNVSYESFSSLGIRGKSADLYENVPNVEKSVIKVKVRTLGTILESHRPDIGSVDLLAIDVEGWEIEVVEGFDLAKYDPKVIIMENLFEEREYVQFMESKGYYLWRRLMPNDIYLKRA